MADTLEVDVHDVQSLLSSSERDYLVRNNGDQLRAELCLILLEVVAISTLKGKKVGLYFSASWCPPCQRFTPNLVDIYNELVVKGDLEIVFVSADEDEESFTGYFSKMPWLAVPFSDSETREALDKCFKVSGIPHLVFLDESGKLLSDRGVEIIGEYGSDGYPFTPERVKEIKDQEEEARKNQTLRSLLETPSRDFVIKANGDKVSNLSSGFIYCLFLYYARGAKRAGRVGGFNPTRTRKSCFTYKPEHDPNIRGLTRTRPVQPEFFNFFCKLIY
ncbi:putative protein-disulfide reductase [Helianthus annuus]|nr:putative protein-disulfide reductase [Helianthus annuus]KAJ0635171.1 putative protein-disulfide reductase [Helianthus annuus]